MSPRPGLASCLLVLLGGTSIACEFVPRDISSLQGYGQVHFLALGEFPSRTEGSLASHYRRKYGLDIKVLPDVELDPQSIDPQRNQLVAEEAIRLMKQAYPRLAEDPQAVLIGLTSHDMYIRGKSWRFAFSYREDDRFAVVSSGRMHLGLTAGQDDVFQARIRKMVMKNVGVLHYRLPISFHSRSVLFGAVGGLEELDAMGEDF